MTGILDRNGPACEAQRGPSLADAAYGVDGCRGGWFYFGLKPGQAPDCGVVNVVEELVSRADASARIFVDIPIGLPAGEGVRLCDTQAREKLQNRRSSVFNAPVREALEARSHKEATRINCEVSGKGLSQQSFAIMPKIREVDELLQRSHGARMVVREVHPEVCFWAFAGGNPMSHNKKTGSGLVERLVLLERFLPSVRADFAKIRSRFPCREVADDDILDAVAAAITASARSSELRTLPECPALYARGLPMEIVYVGRVSDTLGRWAR